MISVLIVAVQIGTLLTTGAIVTAFFEGRVAVETAAKAALVNAFVAFTSLLVLSLLSHRWGYAAWWAAAIAAVAWLWWRRSGGSMRKLAALLGAKSKALRDALVARMPKPRPAPRLRPQAVRS